MKPQLYQEFTRFTRFKTPHCNLEVTDDDVKSPVYGSVVSLTSMKPLLFCPALDCDDYKGCTVPRILYS